jgi:transposase-like protein
MSPQSVLENPVKQANNDQAVPAATVKGPRADRPVRRSFTESYKARIVAEYDAAPKGEKGAILRREKIWDAHIRRWRVAQQNNGLDIELKRGRPPGNPEQKRIRELEKEIELLQAKITKQSEDLDKKDQALEILGKGVAFLEALSSKNA